jgi:hypothetical protein
LQFQTLVTTFIRWCTTCWNEWMLAANLNIYCNICYFTVLYIFYKVRMPFKWTPVWVLSCIHFIKFNSFKGHFTKRHKWVSMYIFQFLWQILIKLNVWYFFYTNITWHDSFTSINFKQLRLTWTSMWIFWTIWQFDETQYMALLL